jgi:hypothetical protein
MSFGHIFTFSYSRQLAKADTTEWMSPKMSWNGTVSGINNRQRRCVKGGRTDCVDVLIDRVCTATSNILNFMLLRFFLHTKTCYQLTCNEQTAPGNSEVYTSLQNCGSSVWDLLHATILLLRIWMWFLEFWKICGTLIYRTCWYL